jgi:hypothetical protein
MLTGEGLGAGVQLALMATKPLSVAEKPDRAGFSTDKLTIKNFLQYSTET